MSSPLPQVKMKNSLKSFSKENNVLASIVASIKDIPNYNELKADLELVDHVCSLIENMITQNNNNNPKIDKKKLCVKIFRTVFPSLSDADVNVIESLIDYIINNNMIKVIPLSSKISRGVFGWLKKKLA